MSVTPYYQIKITGLPVFTIINGKIVMNDNEIISKPSDGELNLISYFFRINI